MPREARKHIIAPGILYHIVVRGNNKKRIFRAIRDYRKLLSILRETKEKLPFYLYTYSLMPNHYHFEVETKDISISKIMHQINNSYVKHFRRRYGGVGHLFQERYFASVIAKDVYLWEVGRYIDLNAPRAGLVEKPEDYPWSSHSIYCQQEYNDVLVDRDLFLSYLNEDQQKARLSYLKFVQNGLLKEQEPPFPISENMI